MSEDMDSAEVCARLERAVARQVASLASLTLLAGSLTGRGSAGLKEQLRGFATAELEDTVRLVEKLVALGGTPARYDALPPPDPEPVAALTTWLDQEEELLVALHAVIEPSGQEPRSEALEHRIEHVLLRKQDQVDALRLTLVDAGDPR